MFDPSISPEDVEAVAEAVRTGEISGSFGATIPAFESEFASYVGASRGVAVTNGTTALQLAVAAAGIGTGDEVLLAASTHVATALAAYHQGAVPVPVDSEPETGNLDLTKIEPLITERTRAILPVHLFGHPVDMDALMEIAERHELIVIEDAAEAHGATVRGRPAGSFGHMACFSFYANKIITTGEGGMVVTSDETYAERLRELRNLGHQQPRFFHSEPGFNFRMTGYQAALGRSQLARIDGVIAEKRRVAETYNSLLADVPGIQRPIEKDWARNVYWMYSIVLADGFPLSRDQLMTHLREAGIETRTAFCPMSMQPFLREQPGYREVPCPVAERLWDTGMYLPSAPSLTNGSIESIVDAIRAVAT